MGAAKTCQPFAAPLGSLNGRHAFAAPGSQMLKEPANERPRNHGIRASLPPQTAAYLTDAPAPRTFFGRHAARALVNGLPSSPNTSLGCEPSAFMRYNVAWSRPSRC